MKFLSTVLILISLGSALQSQYIYTSEGEQKIGVQIIYNYRTIGNLKTKSSIGTIGYEYLTSIGPKVSLYIGANNFIIPSTQSNISDFVSKYSLFYKTSLYYRYNMFYLQTEFLHYTANGKSTYIKSDSKKYIYDNSYSVYEYPIGLGYILSRETISVSLGLLKSFFYGSNEKGLVMAIEDTERVSLGKILHKFIAELPIALEIDGSYDITPDYSLHLNSIVYSRSGFALKISVLGSMP